MQLLPYFQPIIDISTAKVVGHESLARSIDHDGNVKSAWQIFSDKSLNEQHVLAFDRAVRIQAIERFAEAGQPGFLTVNISPRWIDLLHNNWIPTVEMLRMYDVAPDKLVVEIVETDSDSERLEKIVCEYKALGIRVAVDDFGAGSSKFDRVIGLAPDIVKLDMRLFKKAIKGGFPQHIVQSLSFLAERMGSQVLCEGVENYSELRFAMELGSKLIQGFMFSEAKSGFTDPRKFERDIAIQRKRFLLEGMIREERVIEDSKRVQAQVEVLCKQLKKTGVTINPAKIEADRDLITSLFVCDLGGTQISPTYRVINGQWRAVKDNIGTNWCWRPYFYQLLSSSQLMHRKSVTSRAYHDLYCGALIKTIACFVDEKTVLMVDVKDRAEIVL